MGVTHVLAAQVYLGQGETDEVKQIIRSYASSSKQALDSQEFNILNKLSRLQVLAISDRLWTEATGKRTPLGKLGSFWDDSTQAVETIDIDEIL